MHVVSVWRVGLALKSVSEKSFQVSSIGSYCVCQSCI